MRDDAFIFTMDAVLALIPVFIITASISWIGLDPSHFLAVPMQRVAEDSLRMLALGDSSLVDQYIGVSSSSAQWETSYGTSVSLTDDQCQQVDVGFTYSYYGNSFTQVYLCSNGMLRFGGATTNSSNPTFPYNSSNTYIVAPLWDDLNPPAGGAIYYNTIGSSPSRKFVATWLDVPHKSANVSNRFQAILTEGSTAIVFNYQYLWPSVTPTIGLNRGDGCNASIIGGVPGNGTSYTLKIQDSTKIFEALNGTINYNFMVARNFTTSNSLCFVTGRADSATAESNVTSARSNAKDVYAAQSAVYKANYTHYFRMQVWVE